MDNHSWIETALDELRTTLAGKNEDYRIGGEFSNFEYATKIAATTTTQVMLTQIGIKVGRLVGLSDTPKNESFKDSVKDLAGYATILYGYLLQEDSLPDTFEIPEKGNGEWIPLRVVEDDWEDGYDG